MPKCSVIGCDGRRGNNPHNVTLHRLPVVESKRKAWLEIIGSKNINTDRKHVYVCSRHFDDSSFNRTMNIIKLHDDALPSQTLMTPSGGSPSEVFTDTDEDVAVNAIKREDKIRSVPKIISSTGSTENVSTLHFTEIKIEPDTRTALQPTPQNGIPEIPIHARRIIEKLQEKCRAQAKKIKRLNEKVRRQQKKITNFANIIRDLNSNSNHS